MTELTHCVLCVLLVPLSLLYRSTTVNRVCMKYIALYIHLTVSTCTLGTYNKS